MDVAYVFTDADVSKGGQDRRPAETALVIDPQRAVNRFDLVNRSRRNSLGDSGGNLEILSLDRADCIFHQQRLDSAASNGHHC